MTAVLLVRLFALNGWQSLTGGNRKLKAFYIFFNCPAKFIVELYPCYGILSDSSKSLWKGSRSPLNFKSY